MSVYISVSPYSNRISDSICIFLCQCGLYNCSEVRQSLQSMSQVYAKIGGLIKSLDPQFELHNNDLEFYISALSEVVSLKKKKVAPRFNELLAILSEMLAERNSFDLQMYADMYDTIVDAFLVTSKFEMNKGPILSELLRAGVMVLSNISAEVTADWSHPQEIADDNSLYSNEMELRICKEVMANVQELAVYVGNQLIRANFAPIFREYLEINQNWQQKYGALLIASQLGEDVQNIDEVKLYADMGIRQLENEQPKVRFAALELIGQLSEQINPLFQEEYFEAAIPSLLKLLSDSLPRIVGHTFACLSNFLSKFNEYWRIQGISNELLAPLTHYLLNGSPFMQMNALQTVNSLASIKNSLGQNVKFLIETLGQVLHNCSEVTKESEVLNQTFQVVSSLLSSQDKALVGEYLPQFVQSLMQNKSKISEQVFLSSWSNLCLEYEAFIDLDSTHILDHLMNIVSAEQNLDETALLCLECLCNTFKSYSWRMRPYLQTIFSFCKKIFDSEEHGYTIRNKAIEVIVCLLLSVKTEAVQQEDIFSEMAISILQYLIEEGDKCVSGERQPVLLIGILTGVNDLIEHMTTLLDHFSIIKIAQTIMGYMQKIEEETTTVNEASQTEDSHDYEDVNSEDEESQLLVDDDIDQTEDLLDAIEIIPEIYTNLLKIAKENSKEKLVNDLIPEISFAANKSSQWKLFGLNLALALVETCNYGELAAYWGNLYGLFKGFIDNGSSKLRNSSSYGLGLIFEKTPQDLIADQNVVDWTNDLMRSHSTPYDDDKEEKIYVAHCKDNIVAALGKLLKSCGPRFPHLLSSEIYQQWLHSLPLKYDETETDQQQDILIDILSNSPNLLVRDVDDLKKICEVFACYTALRSQEADSNTTLAKSKQCFSRMSEWSLFQRSSEYLQSTLKLHHRSALSKLMAYE